MLQHEKLKVKEILLGIMSGAALYLFLVYAQYLFDVPVNFWLSSLILGVLLGLVFWGCPFIRQCRRSP